MINVRITEVTVSAVPEDSINHSLYAVRVAWRGGETYAVMNNGYCLGTDGEWDYEPLPSSREDDWLASHRFDYDTAYRLAIDVAPKVTCNGRTAVEAAEAHERRIGERE